MKIPLFSKLTAKSRGRKVVRASARAMRGGEEEYDEAEPNMKLSHAFMVVLILHVVAVGGIYAFNHIKVNKNPDLIANLSGRIAKATGMTSSTLAAAPVAPVAPVAPQRQPGDADEPLPMIGSAAPVVSTAAVVATTKPVAPVAASIAVAPAVRQTSPPKAAGASKAAPAASAAGTYKVVKGDNPSKIAKKLGVTSQALLEVNRIADPTKLQIDQILKVPAKAN